MKKIIIPISTLFVVGISHAQTTPNLSTSENYVYSKTYLHYPKPGDADQTIKSSQTVQYLDGLGRPKQIVNIKASPLSKDVVTPIVYDSFGRQTRNYLPVPQNSTSGGQIYSQNYSLVPYPVSDVTNVYNGEKTFTENLLENSPLDRFLEQRQVGDAWNSKPVKFEYDANANGEVKKYSATFNYSNFHSEITLSTGGYGANQLYKNTVIDEDLNKTIEFKNGQGQTVLVRKMLDDTTSADTYYVYNDYNQLAYVIPPLAVAANAVDPVTLSNLCYQYKYDARNRLVEKKLPGKGWEYMLYDKQDRLVATRDSVLEGKGQWLYTKYDQFGRVVLTGISTGGSRVSEQSNVDTFGGNNTPRISTVSFTSEGMDVYYGGFLTYPDNSKYVKLLSVNYYDAYPSYGFNPAIPASIYNVPVLTDNSTGSNISTKSLPVMSFVKNIEDDSWTKNYTWYDNRGKAIGGHSINHLGGYTRTESEVDLSGTPKKMDTYHVRKPGETGIIVKERFIYDHQNRLLEHHHKVDDKAEVLLAQNQYDELSQLKNKKVGNNLQSIDYAYNIRGWMTDINKDQMNVQNLGGKLFSYKIRYNEKVGITNPDSGLFAGKNVAAKYNGNIAEVDWRSVENLGVDPPLNPKRYGYAYDNLNRLMAGYYQNPYNAYSKENTESIDYDLNGNITDLYRTSVTEYGSTIATVTDNLEYIYTGGGNRVTNINDSSANPTGYEGGGQTIGYDVNGNMTDMADKGISTIKYNHLNLPYQLKMQESIEDITIDSKYRADGTRLRKQNTTITSGFGGDMTTIKITDYLDGFQYLSSGTATPPPIGGGSNGRSLRAMEPEAFSIELEKGTLGAKTPDLQFFPTAEGYYDYIKDQYIYQYKDHLGNARVSFGRNSTGALEITDANDYYPFGMNHLKTGNAFFGQGSYKNYKYNGKELQETGMYDYGARFYMPDIGRWGVVDPLAEKMTRHSPFNYAFNNPIKFIDPDGRQAEDIIIKGSKKDQETYLHMLNKSTGNIYDLVDNQLVNKGVDPNFKGNKSEELIRVINKGISSDEIYEATLTGGSKDDKNVFIDNYQSKKIDLTDLGKIGDISSAFQGAAIGHFLNEIQEIGGFGVAHPVSLGVEGKIYGELIGDKTITKRQDYIKDEAVDGYQRAIYEYNPSNRYELLQGATSIKKGTGVFMGSVEITETITLPTGELKSVKKMP